MNMPVLKTETAVSFPTTPAKVLAIAPRKTPFATRALARAKAVAVNVVPPVVVLAISLLVWELLCRKAGATLPPPSKVLKDTWELIVDPFFDRGGLDKGLFWHMSASLQRVALGYALASIVGVAARHAGRPIDLGDARARSDLPGAAHRAAARLAAAVARGVPQRPAVGDLRHLHHRDLADHHQHRGRHPQHPAGLSQRRQGAAPQPARVFLQDHGAGGGALHLHRACASASACRGSPSSPPKC